MPTAAQWLGQVNKRKSAKQGYGGGAWAGGAWKERFMSEAPTRSGPGALKSKDGRAWTPGPGRYSAGNPMNSSVRYDRLKFARVQTQFEEQGARWASDTSFTVAQYGGVVVNPCRGFSMGSGCGPGQTTIAEFEKVGLRTKGPTYQHQGPDLVLGSTSISTRGPGHDGVARARGGGLSGTTFRGLDTGVRLRVPSCRDGRHHDPGPGQYLSDYTFSNIGFQHDYVGMLSTHEHPPAYSISKGPRSPRPSHRDAAPGPADYDPKEYQWDNPSGRGKGQFLADPCVWRSESMAEYRKRVDPDDLGPGAYDIDSSALDFLSTRPRASLCAAVLKPATYEPPAEAEIDDTPGPQDYDVGAATNRGLLQVLGGPFGTEPRVTGGVSSEAAAVPAPGAYTPLLLRSGDFAGVAQDGATAMTGQGHPASGTFGGASPRIPPDPPLRLVNDLTYQVPAPASDIRLQQPPRWSFQKDERFPYCRAPSLRKGGTQGVCDDGGGAQPGDGDAGGGGEEGSHRRSIQDVGEGKGGQRLGEEMGSEVGAQGGGQVLKESGRRRRGNHLVTAAGRGEGVGGAGATSELASHLGGGDRRVGAEGAVGEEASFEVERGRRRVAPVRAPSGCLDNLVSTDSGKDDGAGASDVRASGVLVEHRPPAPARHFRETVDEGREAIAKEDGEIGEMDGDGGMRYLASRFVTLS